MRFFSSKKINLKEFYTKLIIVLSVFFVCVKVQGDVKKDIETLGGSSTFLNIVKSLSPNERVSAVQNRTVDRIFRNELSVGASQVTGGNAYLETQNFELSYAFHINPHWSVGLKYMRAGNKLSQEGKSIIEEGLELSETDPNLAFIPDVDFPLNSYIGVVNWYPIYGKINLYNIGITQFDMYLNMELGQMELSNGPSPIYGLGLGAGFWFSQHLTARIEARYQTYTAQYLSKKQSKNVALFGFSLGFML